MDKKYAIIRSGKTGKLEVVNLADWNDWEWSDFDAVRDITTNEIKFFDKEEDAVSLMICVFPNHMIDPKYFKDKSLCGLYYIGNK